MKRRAPVTKQSASVLAWPDLMILAAALCALLVAVADGDAFAGWAAVDPILRLAVGS